ncbi:N-acetyltransferase family protein [Frisingicoccus sp.]|uniref:GNAT family N-acetyltransferase n=1 Tax=Frisingicoccus sp. TaxID=1918627 RepID=UPI003AB22941
MEYTIRKMTVLEYPLLSDFLYEAIFIPDGIKPPPRDIIASPELQIYIERFGTSKDDFALVAEIERKIVGAVWVRIMNDYGHIDDETPSLAISLHKEYRGKGMGSNMMKEMLSLLKTHGYKRVSLSVQKANYASEMYRKIGFEIIKENGDEWIMLWQEDRH